MRKKLSKFILGALILTLIAVPITSIRGSATNNGGLFTILVDWPDPF